MPRKVAKSQPTPVMAMPSRSVRRSPGSFPARRSTVPAATLRAAVAKSASTEVSPYHKEMASGTRKIIPSACAMRPRKYATTLMSKGDALPFLVRFGSQPLSEASL